MKESTFMFLTLSGLMISVAIGGIVISKISTVERPASTMATNATPETAAAPTSYMEGDAIYFKLDGHKFYSMPLNSNSMFQMAVFHSSTCDCGWRHLK